MFRRTAALAVAAAALASLTACSSGGTDAAPSPSTSTGASTSTTTAASTASAGQTTGNGGSTGSTGAGSSANSGTTGAQGAGSTSGATPAKDSGAITVGLYFDPFLPDGSLRPGYTVKPSERSASMWCDGTGSSGVTGGVFHCGGGADGCVNGLVSPGFPGKVLCVDSVDDKTLQVATKVPQPEGLSPMPPEGEHVAVPVQLVTVDGSTWRLRRGGTGAQRDDDLTDYFTCQAGPCLQQENNVGEMAVFGSYQTPDPVVDKSTQQWTVRVGRTNERQGKLTKVGVAKVWYVKNSSPAGA